MSRDVTSPFEPGAVRALAFDGFGTIFAYPISRFVEFFARLGARLDPPIEGKALWEAWLEVGRRRWGQASPEEGPQTPVRPPFEPYRVLWPLQFRDTFELVGARGDAEAANAWLFREIEAAPAYPEVQAVLDRLRTRYPLALISNADDAFLRPPLAASGLHFDVVVSSEDARAYKPEREIFEHAAARLGLTTRDMLYVGDSPRADIVGALRAEMQVAWLDREGGDLPDGVPQPHLRIPNLEPLLDALALPAAD